MKPEPILTTQRLISPRFLGPVNPTPNTCTLTVPSRLLTLLATGQTRALLPAVPARPSHHTTPTAPNSQPPVNPNSPQRRKLGQSRQKSHTWLESGTGTRFSSSQDSASRFCWESALGWVWESTINRRPTLPTRSTSFPKQHPSPYPLCWLSLRTGPMESGASHKQLCSLQKSWRHLHRWVLE